MRLSKRARALLNAIRRGDVSPADLDGVTPQEALKVVRIARGERERLRERTLRVIADLEKELESLRAQLVLVEADIGVLRAAEESLQEETAAQKAG